MYMLVLMSSVWYAKKFNDIESASSDAQDHIDNGDIVAFCEDIDYFADKMNIIASNIQIVEGE